MAKSNRKNRSSGRVDSAPSSASNESAVDGAGNSSADNVAIAVHPPRKNFWMVLVSVVAFLLFTGFLTYVAWNVAFANGN